MRLLITTSWGGGKIYVRFVSNVLFFMRDRFFFVISKKLYVIIKNAKVEFIFLKKAVQWW